MMNSAVKMLDAAAERFGDRPAIEEEDTVISYCEYRETARHIAAGLLPHTEQRRPVLVFLPKSIRALCSFMGALYAGCPYVPVDTEMPASRFQKLLTSLRPGVILTDQEHLDQFQAKAEGTESAPICLFEDLAMCRTDDTALLARLDQVIDTDPIYIMFTSGSTGTPKGVTIPHRGILDYAQWVTETFQFGETVRMANQAPLYFDNSTFDIYGCMYCGGCVVLIPDVLVYFPVRLPEFLREKRITSIFWVPTVLINIANADALAGVDLPELQTVAFCGEVMPNKQLNIWRRALPGRVFANLYGPTEITDVCCYYIVDRAFSDSEPLPIGRACENMRVSVLRKDGSEALPGEQGELCVSGSGVALGYWREPELTARAFIHRPTNPEWGERYYRTGDLAYRDDAGLIWFCGRKDNQIKWKGNRIELGEIEMAAMCVDGVGNAAALFDREKEHIVLFIESDTAPVLRLFNQELKKYLPQYMLPRKLVTLKALPHTANDKIDRVALRAQMEGAKE